MDRIKNFTSSCKRLKLLDLFNKN